MKHIIARCQSCGKRKDITQWRHSTNIEGFFQKERGLHTENFNSIFWDRPMTKDPKYCGPIQLTQEEIVITMRRSSYAN